MIFSIRYQFLQVKDEELREQLITESIHAGTIDNQAYSLSGAIMSAFEWYMTGEFSSKWERVYQMAKNGEIKLRELTQVELIECHLRKEGSINPMEALNRYGCFRLASRIYELRDKGMKIKTENGK